MMPAMRLFSCLRFRAISRRASLFGSALLAVCLLPAASAEQAYLAAATNFRHAAESLSRDFEAATGHSIILSTGSTGMLYAQIIHGAPFDIFLAADAARPKRLEDAGQIVPGSRQTYAIGQLVLWSPVTNGQRLDGRSVLTRANFAKLAMANPALAPYGAAAQEVLQELDLDEALQEKIVTGQNIGQTFALVATGNAELGFVALSSVQALKRRKSAYWLVPQVLYTPIEQQGVLLASAQDNAAAIAFMAYLKTPQAQRLIAKHGYKASDRLTEPPT